MRRKVKKSGIKYTNILYINMIKRNYKVLIMYLLDLFHLFVFYLATNVSILHTFVIYKYKSHFFSFVNNFLYICIVTFVINTHP